MIGSAVDVFEEEGLLVVEMALPGVRVEDLSINACGSRLLIWARRPGEGGERRYRVRGTRLPPCTSEEVALPPEARVADATALLKHGVLQVRIPLSGGTCEAVRPVPVNE